MQFWYVIPAQEVLKWSFSTKLRQFKLSMNIFSFSSMMRSYAVHCKFTLSNTYRLDRQVRQIVGFRHWCYRHESGLPCKTRRIRSALIPIAKTNRNTGRRRDQLDYRSGTAHHPGCSNFWTQMREDYRESHLCPLFRKPSSFTSESEYI